MDQTRTYEQRPDLSERYSAIDGVEGPTHERGGEQKPIRSDIEKILALSDEEFVGWYSKRKDTTRRLLADYELFASIPHLYYSHENQKNNMAAITHVGYHINYLKEGLEFLEIIRERYYEENQ